MSFRRVSYRLIPKTGSGHEGADIEANVEHDTTDGQENPNQMSTHCQSDMEERTRWDGWSSLPFHEDGVIGRWSRLKNVIRIGFQRKEIIDNNRIEDLQMKPLVDNKIHQYAKVGDVQQCLMLLEKPDFDVNVKGEDDMTPLHLASQNDHGDLVRELLKRGANRYATECHGLIPLHLAAHSGCLDSIKELLDGNNPESRQLSVTDSQGNTALHLAAKRNDSSIVKFLLERKANPKFQNKKKVTPLHYGASQKTKASLELLCESAQPDIFQDDATERNILHYAVTQENGACLKYLLEKEYVRKHIDSSGSSGTPLMYALGGRKIICANALLDAGASLTSDLNGTYPIHKAVEFGYYKVCQKMLQIDDSTMIKKDKLNKTIFHLAAKSGNLETLDVVCNKLREAQMKEARTILSSVDDSGQTALHIAVKKGDEQALKMLFRCNIPCVTKDANGHNALHLAAELGKTKCCELLVTKARSCLYGTDHEGEFPLDKAFKFTEKNKSTIIYLLREMSSQFSKKINNRKKDYLHNFKLLKGRIRKYVHEALNKTQSPDIADVIEAVLQSMFWKDVFFGRKELKPENFKKLVTVHPTLAKKLLDKCCESKFADDMPTYTFLPYENTYYMEDEGSPFDENNKLKEEASDHLSDTQEWVKSHPVKHMISEAECDLMKHRVTIAWISHKWKSYIMYIHYGVLIIDLLHLLALICLMATTWNWTQISHDKDFKNISKEEFCDIVEETIEINSTETSVVNDFKARVEPYQIFYYLVITIWVLKIIIEIFYVVRLRTIYVRSEMMSHAFTQLWSLFLTAVLIFSPLGMCYQLSIGLLQEDWAWQCGIFALLMSWIHLINGVHQAFPLELLPITNDIFEICLRVAYFLISFVAIFAFIFHLLLLENKSFASVFQSLASTLCWMLTDLNYSSNFVEEELSYPVLSNIIFLAFITTICALLVSLISQRGAYKAKGRALDHSYRRLVSHTKMIFRYDVCFPSLRRRYAVSKSKSKKTRSAYRYPYEFCLEQIRNTDSADYSDDKKLFEQIKTLESVLSEAKEDIFTNKQILKELKKPVEEHFDQKKLIEQVNRLEKTVEKKLESVLSEVKEEILKEIRKVICPND